MDELDAVFENARSVLARIEHAAERGLGPRREVHVAITEFDLLRRELDDALGSVRRRLVRAADRESLETIDDRWDGGDE